MGLHSHHPRLLCTSPETLPCTLTFYRRLLYRASLSTAVRQTVRQSTAGIDREAQIFRRNANVTAQASISPPVSRIGLFVAGRCTCHLLVAGIFTFDSFGGSVLLSCHSFASWKGAAPNKYLKPHNIRVQNKVAQRMPHPRMTRL